MAGVTVKLARALRLAGHSRSAAVGGHYREFENLIERVVILSQGAELYVPRAKLKAVTSAETQPITSMEAAERDHIMRAHQAAKWIIGGPAGAAAKLE